MDTFTLFLFLGYGFVILEVLGLFNKNFRYSKLFFIFEIGLLILILTLILIHPIDKILLIGPALIILLISINWFKKRRKIESVKIILSESVIFLILLGILTYYLIQGLVKP